MARQSRPTIYDVAREAGVSKSLVSLVLNDSPLVAEPKRQAVREAIAKLGYRRSRAAAALARSRTRTVGLVIDDFRNPWFVELLEGLRSVLGPKGFHVAIREHYRSDGELINAIDGFLDTQVDALVVGAEPGRDFDNLGIPTIVEGTREHGVAGADVVGCDQDQGVRLLVEHLIGLGHTRIGHVTGLGGSARVRREAFDAAMTQAGLPAWIAGGDNPTNEEGGYAGTVELLRRHPDVTAIFAANDTMALGARGALHEIGRQVPEGLALVGYDNSQLARSRYLDLTTVDTGGFAIGEACGRCVLERMADPDAEPKHLLLPARLVVRSSSGSVVIK